MIALDPGVEGMEASEAICDVSVDGKGRGALTYQQTSIAIPVHNQS
jgi:hypothetical protein